MQEHLFTSVDRTSPSAIEYTLWKRRFWTFYFSSFLPWPIDITSVCFPPAFAFAFTSILALWTRFEHGFLSFFCLFELCLPRLALYMGYDTSAFPECYLFKIRLEPLVACIFVTVYPLRLRVLSPSFVSPSHTSSSSTSCPQSHPDPYIYIPIRSLRLTSFPFVLFSVWPVLGLVYLRIIALLVILLLLFQS